MINETREEILFNRNLSYKNKDLITAFNYLHTRLAIILTTILQNA